MKKIFLFFLLLFFSSVYASDIFIAEEIDFSELTSEFSGDFSYYSVSLKANNIFDDVKVSIVESIPFAFLFTFAYLFVSEAVQQSTLQPKMKTLEEYKEIYFKNALIFITINLSFNFLTYYKY